jgi:anti-sigma B factor antagonist
MYSSETIDGNVIIHFNEARATLAYSGGFKEFTIKQLESNGNKLIIDLTKSEYIDSTFMGALVELYKKTNKAGGKMKIVCFEKIKYIICVVSRLSSFIEVFDNIEDAVKSFNE